MPFHADYTDADLHVPGYRQSSDPGAVGAGKDWLDTSTSPPTLKRRNATNAGWDIPLTGGAPPTGSAGGDLTGSYPNPTVNIDGKTAKTTPVDADETVLADSAASFATKKLSWANIKATLKTYFDSLYQAVGSYVTTARTISTTAPLTGGGDLSANRTLDISNFTGDSGSGGAKGAVPAPASGDAAAGKYLKSDGTWAVPPGSGAAFSGARVYNNAAISINNNTATTLTFNSERYDTASYHSTVSNTDRLTIPTTGYYRVTGQIEWAPNANGRRAIWFYLNGTTQIAVVSFMTVTDGGATVVQEVVTDYSFTAGDYVTLNVFQLSGGSLNVNSTGNFSPEFSIQYLGS